MTGVFKSITYKYTDSDKDDLVVVFPQAMQTSDDSKPVVSLLSELANVTFIESGYYGITKLDSFNHSDSYSISNFKTNLRELLNKIPHKKLYLVAGSVGAIHALSFLETYPHEVAMVALAGPALYRNRGRFVNNLYKLFLWIGIVLYPDKYFEVMTHLFQSHPNTPWLRKIYKSVITKIGAKSFFLCLKEIVNFTSKNRSRLENMLSEKVYIFLGDNDDVFNYLCDKNLCSKAKSCQSVKFDHDSTINGARKQIFNLLKASII